MKEFCSLNGLKNLINEATGYKNSEKPTCTDLDQKYDNDVFRSEIQTFCFLNKTDLGLFKESIFCTFNKHAPIRKKYLRANEVPFMTKELHDVIMKRSRYRNKFLKGKSQTSRENYKIQQNLCEKLLSKTKKSYFESLNIKTIMDNRTSWKTVVPHFTIKASRGEKNILNEAEKHIFDDKKILHNS